MQSSLVVFEVDSIIELYKQSAMLNKQVLLLVECYFRLNDYGIQHSP